MSIILIFHLGVQTIKSLIREKGVTAYVDRAANILLTDYLGPIGTACY